MASVFKDVELPQIEANVMGYGGGKVALGKVKTYPIHSFSCKRCGETIEVRSETRPSDHDDKKFNCKKCAKYIRKEDLRYEDCHESPDNKGTKSIVKTGRPIGSSRIGDRIGGNVLQELTALALCIRSCRVTVYNETPHVITSSGLVIFGHHDNQLDTMDISPNESQRYDYSMRFSLKGCAGIQKFTVTFSETSTLCFFVAFKNSTIQLRNDDHNKVALLLVTNDYIDKDLDVRYFNKVMKNEKPCPTFDGCLQDNRYKRTHRSSIASKENIFKMECNNITIQVSMTHTHHCDVVVKVISKKAITQNSE